MSLDGKTRLASLSLKQVHPIPSNDYASRDKYLRPTRARMDGGESLSEYTSDVGARPYYFIFDQRQRRFPRLQAQAVILLWQE